MSDTIYSEEYPYLLFSEEEFNQAKSRDLLTCRCTKCGKEFKKTKTLIKVDIKNHKINQFCSHKCSDSFRRKSLVLTTPHICKFCNKEFTVLPSKYASGNFCSKDCSIRYSSSFGNTEEKRKQKSKTITEYFSNEENKEKLALAILSSDKCKVRYYGNYGDVSAKENKSTKSNKQVRHKKEKNYDELYNSIMTLYEDYNHKELCEKLNISQDVYKTIQKKYNFKDNDKFIKPSHVGIIKICKQVLNKETSITHDDYKKVQSIFYNHLYVDNLSSLEIKNLYNIEYSEFSVCLNKVFKLPMRSLSEASINYNTKKGVYDNKSEKEIYYMRCKFTFGIEDYKKIEGFNLIPIYGMFSPDNLNGVARDHMISINYGWTHNIPPEIISHPANCQIMLQKDNTKKSIKCSLTLEELQERIKNW